MEQAFADANNPMFKARRILEINPKHDLFARLQKYMNKAKKVLHLKIIAHFYMLKHFLSKV